MSYEASLPITAGQPITINPTATYLTDSSGNIRLNGPNNALLPIPYIAGQSAVPVMLAQSGFVYGPGGFQGFLIPGQGTYSVTVGLSATSGSGVTVTLGTALLTGTSADNGKQLTVYDSVNATFRSILITAFNSTTVCTGTLASTFSSTSIAATLVLVGNSLPANCAGVWVYLPAGAAFSGAAAGFYWAYATSTATANGILQVTTTYQATMGTPSIPTGALTNAVGSGVNFTQTTSSGVQLASLSLPGGSMGANGSLRISNDNRFPSTTNLNSTFLSFGGITFDAETNPGTVVLKALTTIRNRGVENVQIGGTNGYGAYVGQFGLALEIAGTVDTSQTKTIAFYGQLLTSPTDFIVLEGYTVEV